MTCYVCLEDTDVICTASPCECGIPVHRACLLRVMREMPQRQCTVCHRPFEVSEAFDAEDLAPSEEDVSDACETCVGCLVACLTICVWYLCAGWLGQLFLLGVGYRIEHFFHFWEMEHMLGAIAVSVAVGMCMPTTMMACGRPVR